MRTRNIILAAALLCAAGGFGVVRAADAPDDIIAARQAGYKHIGALFGQMRKGIDSGADVTAFAAPAREIADWGRKIPTLFPPGTETGHGTHARPDIWTDRAGFDKDSAALVTQAEALAQTAASGDKAAFAAQWKVTGGACGACHRAYRSRIL